MYSVGLKGKHMMQVSKNNLLKWINLKVDTSVKLLLLVTHFPTPRHKKKKATSSKLQFHGQNDSSI